jgi:hypothetical protein
MDDNDDEDGGGGGNKTKGKVVIMLNLAQRQKDEFRTGDKVDRHVDVRKTRKCG